MDPDETLKRLREALKVMDTTRSMNELMTASVVVLETMTALDEWITKGGYLPKDWKRD